MTIELFNDVSNECSKKITQTYSTSFSSAIKLLHTQLRKPIYNIYGFVRFADEIVDTFHEFDKKELLNKFKAETFEAIKTGISLNPVLNSFQQTVNQYNIDHKLIHAFFTSMESDLSLQSYNRDNYELYIYGSAEVVGLMCLYVFCDGNGQQFEELKSSARALGAAFQKVNFLRDIQSDFKDLSRVYFPYCNFEKFTDQDKLKIESEIELDFEKAYQGIFKLPLKAKFGVYVSYKYYYSLFRKIKSLPSENILKARIRIPNYYKLYIIFRAGIKNRLHLIK